MEQRACVAICSSLAKVLRCRGFRMSFMVEPILAAWECARMSMTATLNEAGHVILPASVLRLFDLRGERQLEVDVVGDGVRLHLGKAREVVADALAPTRQEQVEQWLQTTERRQCPAGLSTDSLLSDNRSEV
jgi:bifunctional DNA-binding transcriptional regulator/antitoxin component of YhaV-PrlF toxin-antitoxin module